MTNASTAEQTFSKRTNRTYRFPDPIPDTDPLAIETRIADALGEYPPDGPRPCFTALALKYNVPYQQLYARFHGRGTRSQRARPSGQLTTAQEKRPCEVLAGFVRAQGKGVTREVVEESVNAILKVANKGVLEGHGVGGEWARRWLYQHLEIAEKEEEGQLGQLGQLKLGEADMGGKKRLSDADEAEGQESQGRGSEKRCKLSDDSRMKSSKLDVADADRDLTLGDRDASREEPTARSITTSTSTSTSTSPSTADIEKAFSMGIGGLVGFAKTADLNVDDMSRLIGEQIMLVYQDMW
ncbi:hypothetical protein H2201_004309 [Coniosporium apollinis]|uniref:HTH CENPB-type domain-containing protein n=2 Tax=Coniosporium TaxID=2810619 RepID=A0ABQ9NZQ6_9PEZI|nr:hypothetical protein H2199_000076 [Cladosporium sp. JES 115]KAJ9665617.1 hypothetical protein H2201_004309 [Coniosporium apollinis]